MQAHISAYQAMKSCCGKTKSNSQAFSAVTYSYYDLLNTSKNIRESKTSNMQEHKKQNDWQNRQKQDSKLKNKRITCSA